VLGDATNRLPIDPILLSPTKADLKRWLADLEAEVEQLEQTVDTYEATILLQDGYCRATNRKLYKKENKHKTKRQILADHGKWDMTHEEWLDAMREESTLKEQLEGLKAEKKAWRANEQATQSAENTRIAKEWADYAAPFKAMHKRPPNRKPAEIKRAPTPERFLEIKRLKQQLAGVTQEEERDDRQEEQSNDGE
jgi:hypothetical protein